MSYTHSTLEHGEQVVHRSRISWIVYAPCLISVLLGAVIWTAVFAYSPIVCRVTADNFVNVFSPGSWPYPEDCVNQAIRKFGDFRFRLGWTLFVPAAYLFTAAWIRRYSTEIVVTSHRIVLKRGFIQRHTIEISADKIESVDVDQTLAGRIFDFGFVTIRGTGSTFERLGPVDEPLKLRTSIEAN